MLTPGNEIIYAAAIIKILVYGSEVVGDGNLGDSGNDGGSR